MILAIDHLVTWNQNELFFFFIKLVLQITTTNIPHDVVVCKGVLINYVSVPREGGWKNPSYSYFGGEVKVIHTYYFPIDILYYKSRGQVVW